MITYTLQKPGQDAIKISSEAEEDEIKQYLNFDVDIIKTERK